MKIFLAGTCTDKNIKGIEHIPYILESFYYFKEFQKPLLKKTKMFLLDSGAFTFMNSNAKISIDVYIDKYIKFINENNIKYFFELDIDNIVGYNKVLEIRKKIETQTKRKSIPVWHISRGFDNFVKTTKEYDYIAIGGIVTKEIKNNQYPIFDKLIKIAHNNNCKVHGLGFTNLKKLPQYHFDSVDSTSWLSGGRFAQAYKFNGKTLIQYNKPENKKVKHYRLINEYNLKEWMKFQKYADTHL